MSAEAYTNDLNTQCEIKEEINNPVDKVLTKKEKRKLYNESRKSVLKAKREEYLASKQVGYNIDTLNDTYYYFENGLRKVKPYMYLWKTTAKERWFTRTIFDVYSNEFERVLKNDDLAKMINTGKIRVNDQKKDCNYIIKNGDVITHIKHRHELPVIGDPIEIVADTDDILAINKPCSIPIHPCGKYRYNTLLIILQKEMNYNNIRNIYRLDRLTSGIVLFAKNFKIAKYLDSHIKDRTAEKTYVCRVIGNFPDEEITVDQPLDCVSFKAGLFWVNSKGKQSETKFKKLSYNGKSSVVLCYPKTGRTHQIRIHLQYLGHPIVNDPLYNDKNVWGEENGKNAVYEGTQEEIELKFLKIHSRENWILDNDNDELNLKEIKEIKEEKIELNNDDDKKDNINAKRKDNEEIVDNNKKLKIDNEDIQPFDMKNIKNPVDYDDDCWECKIPCRDPPRDYLIMYLHALSYKLGDIEYKTKLPNWAEENWNEN